jgi:hypothetical protein
MLNGLTTLIVSDDFYKSEWLYGDDIFIVLIEITNKSVMITSTIQRYEIRYIGENQLHKYKGEFISYLGRFVDVHDDAYFDCARIVLGSCATHEIAKLQ